MPSGSVNTKSRGLNLAEAVSSAKKSFVVTVNGVTVPVKGYSGGDIDTATNTISNLTLEAYLVKDNKVLAELAYEIAQNKSNPRAKIVLTEMAKDKSLVKTFTYDTCLLTSLDFPTVDAKGGEFLTETAIFKTSVLTIS